MPVTREITGGTLVVDARDAHWLGASPYVVQATYSLYVSVYCDGKRKRLARLIADAPQGIVVDHINGNPLDNRRCNLRLCTVQQNNWNRRRRIGGRSEFKGVTKKGGRWVATIWPNGKQRGLGSYDTAEQAARAYDRAAREEYGEFACLNFPDHSAGDVRSARLHANPNNPKGQSDRV